MGIRAIFSNNRFISRSRNGTVHPRRRRNTSFSNNHPSNCLCRECSRRRNRERNTAVLALCPFLGIILLLGLVS